MARSIGSFLTAFLASLSLATVLPSQDSLHSHARSKNVTLDFDDLPTRHGYGKISTYHHLDFSSFRLVNTTSAAEAGSISNEDAFCATSSHNALIAHRSKTLSLWPRIELSPHARALPGEIPFFSLHGMSMKPMNNSKHPVCISISTYGIDETKAGTKIIRAFDSLVLCFPPSSPGTHLDISDLFPGWGKTVSMFEMYAEAVVQKGEGYEFVDHPFCVDDIVIEKLGGNERWSWPEPWWPKVMPLLPPLAPFKFDDEEDQKKELSGQYPAFSTDTKLGLDMWMANGAHGIFLSTNRPMNTF